MTVKPSPRRSAREALVARVDAAEMEVGDRARDLLERSVSAGVTSRRAVAEDRAFAVVAAEHQPHVLAERRHLLQPAPESRQIKLRHTARARVRQDQRAQFERPLPITYGANLSVTEVTRPRASPGRRM